MATTRAVSIREFREHLPHLLREAQEHDVHFIVMRHAVPVAHVSPIVQDDASLEMLAARVKEARKAAAEGVVYSTDDVLAMIDRYAHRVRPSGSGRSAASVSGDGSKNRQKNGVVRKTRESSGIRKKAH